MAFTMAFLNQKALHCQQNRTGNQAQNECTEVPSSDLTIPLVFAKLPEAYQAWHSPAGQEHGIIRLCLKEKLLFRD